MLAISLQTRESHCTRPFDPSFADQWRNPQGKRASQELPLMVVYLAQVVYSTLIDHHWACDQQQPQE